MFNIGGGIHNKVSLIDLICILENELKKKVKIKYDKWRPADQKVYISDISKAKRELSFMPNIRPEQGVKMIIEYLKNNKYL